MRFLTLAILLLTATAWLFGQSKPQLAPSAPGSPDPALQTNKGHDPLLDLPPLPHNPVSLIGGVLTHLDPVQDRLTVQVFGGQKTKINFDVRTKFYFNGTPVRERELKQGQRVYVDTMLDGQERVFAKSIWINTAPVLGDGRGQIIDYDASSRVLHVRDELSSQTMRFQVLPSTIITRGDKAGSVGDLEPGALVSLKFGPRQERYPTVQQISLIAKPGSVFSFFGTITFIDLSQRVIAVDNRTDDNKYQISLDGVPDSVARSLHQGDQVGISAVFDGRNYVARSIKPALGSHNTSQ